jgi:hypothetical protein
VLEETADGKHLHEETVTLRADVEQARATIGDSRPWARGASKVLGRDPHDHPDRAPATLALTAVVCLACLACTRSTRRPRPNNLPRQRRPATTCTRV